MLYFRSVIFRAPFHVSASVFSLMIIALLSISQQSAESRGMHFSSGYQHYSDGVTVRKNPDGTIETFDSGSSAQPFDSSNQATSRHPIVSRAYTKNFGGIHVRRNADGTVETYEAPSRPVPLYPSAHRARSARHSK